MKPSTASPPRHESASAPALNHNHRHPFFQARRQPHQHGATAASESALDVTAAEKREHHHHPRDVENAVGGNVPPSLPASPVAVVPGPGDPAHPSNDGESSHDDDEVRSRWRQREREREPTWRERTRASKGDRCHHVKGWGSKARRGETRRATPSVALPFFSSSLLSLSPPLSPLSPTNQPPERTNKNSTSTTPTAPPGSAPPSWEPTTGSFPPRL